ncbi:hypothetical protein L1987_48276 [Smallanthus sonchifolius]|uniref:Uncharacterized protein n=1 Tax=Smallanthus sonchifolius TaxID=185202 RepID=A0ACB9FR73_9ASTR|nr:hypothetical protein L1987_48276 [Smallanthus sonchifolius]
MSSAKAALESATQEGVRVLWTGIGPNVAPNAINNAAELANYDQVEGHLPFYKGKKGGACCERAQTVEIIVSRQVSQTPSDLHFEMYANIASLRNVFCLCFLAAVNCFDLAATKYRSNLLFFFSTSASAFLSSRSILSTTFQVIACLFHRWTALIKSASSFPGCLHA